MYKCDSCGQLHNECTPPSDWNELNGHHSKCSDGWEVHIQYRACSPKCYIKLFQKTVEELKHYPDAEIENLSLKFVKRLSDFFDCVISPNRFIITYKDEETERELFWETYAKTPSDAIDRFWKTHDVLCEFISIKEV